RAGPQDSGGPGGEGRSGVQEPGGTGEGRAGVGLPGCRQFFRAPRPIFSDFICENQNPRPVSPKNGETRTGHPHFDSLRTSVAYNVTKLTDYSEDALERTAGGCVRACAEEAAAVRSEAELKMFRDRWIGRKNGILTQINDLWLKGAPKDAKREAGIRVNELKARIQELVEGARVCHDDGVPAAAEGVDISLPGVRRPIGAEHPVIKTTNEMVRVFQKLGYSVADGPVVETDYYNFEALNFPPNHPARDTQDTLFIAGQQGKAQRERLLLRTHTSPVQIRTMEKMRPPIRIVIPGTVHRNDPPDASHSPMFHQI